jgi:hypothetical protein
MFLFPIVAALTSDLWTHSGRDWFQVVFCAYDWGPVIRNVSDEEFVCSPWHLHFLMDLLVRHLFIEHGLKFSNY